MSEEITIDDFIETMLAPLMILGDLGYLILLAIIILDIIVVIMYIYDYNKRKEIEE